MMNETVYLFALSSPDILERIVERVQSPPFANPPAVAALPLILPSPPALR